MKIIAYLNPNCIQSANIRQLMRKHGLQYEERSALDHEVKQNSNAPLSKSLQALRVEVNGEVLSNPDSKVLEDYLLARGLVNSACMTPNVAVSEDPVLIDEENEALRSKTTRFF